jgi:hypothetical protein
VNESPFFKALKSLRPVHKPALSAAERDAEASARAARVAAHAARTRDAGRARPWAYTRGGTETRKVVLAMAGSGPLAVKTVAARTGLPLKEARWVLNSGCGRWFEKVGRATYRLLPDWQERLFGDEVSA